jgi:hypothetical protein
MLESWPVASDQRRKGRKSMSRRSGQKGQVVKKGCNWHVRFYVDVPGQEERQRKSVVIGPCIGPEKITKAKAQRKGAEVINSLGVNTEQHLQRAINPQTFKQRVEWCRNNRSAWLDGKPGSVLSMESQLEKHILPRFGDLPLHMVDETAVQEFISHLKRTTFVMRKKDGTPIKNYKLSRKTILNIVGVVKSIMDLETRILFSLWVDFKRLWRWRFRPHARVGLNRRGRAGTSGPTGTVFGVGVSGRPERGRAGRR